MTESPCAPRRRYRAAGPVPRDLDGRYPIVLATLGSCAIPHLSSFLWSSLCPEVLSGCGDPLWQGGPSRRSAAQLSLRAWPPPTGARVVPMPVSSHMPSAFPPFGPGRRSTLSPAATSGGTPIVGLQSFADVQARRCAHHP